MCRSAKCWHIPFYSIKKVTFVFNVILLEKVFKVLAWYQAHTYRHRFSQILILLESSNFTTATNSDSCFPWRDKLISLIFEWMPDTHVWISIVWKMLFHEEKKMASSACNSNNCTNVFSGDRFNKINNAYYFSKDICKWS